MRKVLQNLFLIMALVVTTAVMPFSTPTAFAACDPAVTPVDPNNMSPGQKVLIETDSAGTHKANQYFVDKVFEVDITKETVPSNYVFKEMEAAIFNASNDSYYSYIGSTKETCMRIDFGDPAAYNKLFHYEWKYRLVYTVLGDQLQDVKTSWRSYNTSGFYFGQATPIGADPNTKENENRSWIESKDATDYVKYDAAAKNSRTLVLTDNSYANLDFKSEVWYAELVQRDIENVGKDEGTGPANYKTTLSRNFSLPLKSNFEERSHDIQLDMFTEINTPTPKKVTKTDKVDLYVVRDIFNSVFDISIKNNSGTYQVTFTKKSGLSSQLSNMVDNSLSNFGIDLTRPYFVITDKPEENIESYSSDRVRLDLNNPVTFSFSGTGPVLRIGYLGVGKDGYTRSIPLQDVLSAKVAGIPANGEIETTLTEYVPTFEVKQGGDLFRFPANASFDWNKFSAHGVSAEVVVLPIQDSSSIPTDPKALFTGSTTKTTSKASDDISKLKLTASGNYLLAIKAINKYGEEVYDMKQLNLLMDGDINSLTVENNTSYTYDGTSIRANSNLMKEHKIKAVDAGVLKLQTQYNYKHGVLAIGSKIASPGESLTLLNADLTPYTGIDLSTLNSSSIYDIKEYNDGFLVAGEFGLKYFDLTNNTAENVPGSPTVVYSIVIDGLAVYLGGNTTLTVGRISGGNYKETTAIENDKVFGGSGYAVKHMQKIGNQLLVGHDDNASPTSLTVINVE